MKLTPARQKKVVAMRRACEAIQLRVKLHPEHDGDRYSDEPDIVESTFESSMRGSSRFSVEARTRFEKYGSEIFRVPPEEDDGDYDWPELIGRKILAKIAKDAARDAGLSLGRAVRATVTPSEKGYVYIGYELTF